MRWFVPCLLALALPVFAQTGAPPVDSEPAAERNVAGTIDLIEGDVRIFDADKKRRAAARGDKIYEGESIVTGKDGEVQLTMEDSGFIGVRPDTRMRFARYQARGEATDTSVIGLLKGAVRSVTGWIGKYNASNYQVRTPTATIGVRGTDHETMVIQPGQGDGEAGTYDKVNIGGTTLQTKNGKVDVEPARAGFVPLGPGARPQLLAQVPQFFKPTRHEAAFQGKHEAIHKVIEQRREEKRKAWQQSAAKQQTLKKDKRSPDQEKSAADRKRQKEEQRKANKEKRQKPKEAHKPGEHQ